jgi:hypothetical protein
VRTDTDGSYSITGLPAGAYTVLPELRGQGVPAQGPIFVSVDGQNSVTVDLAYYSQSQPPPPTDTPQPPVTLAEPPAALPASGAPGQQPLLLIGLGVLLFAAGGFWMKGLRAARRD